MEINIQLKVLFYWLGSPEFTGLNVTEAVGGGRQIEFPKASIPGDAASSTASHSKPGPSSAAIEAEFTSHKEFSPFKSCQCVTNMTGHFLFLFGPLFESVNRFLKAV